MEISDFTEEDEQILEKLSVVDSWLAKRVNRLYTEEFGEELARKAGEAIHPDFKEEAPNGFIDYTRNGILDMHEGFFAAHYLHSRMTLALYEEEIENATPDQLETIKPAITAAQKMMTFAQSLDDLSEEGIEKAFTTAYESPKAFQGPIIESMKLVLSEVLRNYKEPEIKSKGVFAFITEEQERIHKRQQLRYEETCRELDTIFPKIAECIVGDLYEK